MPIVATVGKIIEINPIEGADFIVAAKVGCGKAGAWQGVVKKGDFQPGDLATVFLQDALLPQTEEFAFMERHHYRVKMARFKGVPSECLIMPYKSGEIGEDVASVFGVEKYEKPIPPQIAGQIYGNFPWFIPKTDEPNFQTVQKMIDALRGKDYIITQKADGSSGTFYCWKNHFGVCSRNLELKDTPENVFWNMARRYNLDIRLPDGFAIQGEVVGPGIQGNPLGLESNDLLVFNAYDISNHEYLGWDEMKRLCWQIGATHVNLAMSGSNFDLTVDDLRVIAEEGKYPNGKPQEGIVIRPRNEMVIDGQRLSFKVISLIYKDKS